MKKYGVEWSTEATDAQIELSMAFDVHGGWSGSLHDAPGFGGAFDHLRRAIDLIYNRERPALIWNEWSELMMRELIGAYHRVDGNDVGELVLAGPSASWKSTCVACFIDAALLSDPLQIKCVISSTSLSNLRELIWKDISRFHRLSGCGYGNLIQHPHPKLQTVKGDDGAGIFGVAVEQGDTDDAIERIKGRHQPKVIVGIEECPGSLEAIVDACINLRSGCQRFMLVATGNPCSYFDQHGRLAEPENGWSSVTVDFDRWKTKRGGICVHLNGRKAPNVVAKQKDKYPGMINQDDMDTTAKQYGENSPRFWQERLGFWPPEGLSKTVISESMIEKFHGREKAVWVDQPIIGSALDPAFEGGDRRVLRFFACGRISVPREPWQSEIDFRQAEEDYPWAISFSDVVKGFPDIVLLKIDVTSKEPIHYQIARAVREECKARGVPSKYFGMDVTGEGGGVASILKREWAVDFVEVEFGGSASSRPVSEINPRTGKEEYVNRVTELWFQVRVALENNHIRGLESETCVELCSRKVDYQKWAPRVKLESKSEMKGLGGRSPDLADDVAVAVETARQRIKEFSVSDTEAGVSDNRWQAFKERANVDIDEESYVSQPAEDW